MEHSMLMTEGQTAPPEPRARRSVRVQIAGGTFMEGNLVVPKTRTVFELLNGLKPFLEFESCHGDRFFVAKAQIMTVQMLDYPRPSGGSTG